MASHISFSRARVMSVFCLNRMTIKTCQRIYTPLAAIRHHQSLEGTFHRRVLPTTCIPFSSSQGKELFKGSLENGYLEGYFQLAEHFNTQADPAYCGVSSLTMALNALLLDPNRVWKGIWRWFDESMLNCEPLDVIRMKGISLGRLADLARCNGANTVLKYADEVSLEEFREDVKDVSTLAEGPHTIMLASYHRGTLKQTGCGHFSPIGAYNSATDMVLIMDVARFKYPPHWVSLPLLYQSMQVADAETGKPRGYLLLNSSTKLYEKCTCPTKAAAAAAAVSAETKACSNA